MSTCKFCEIMTNELLRQDEDIIFENDQFIVLVDKYRKTSLGLICLVIPKDHVKNLLELNVEMGNALLRTIQVISKSMQTTYDCNGIRIWAANNKEAGQSIDHCHVHVVPCKSNFDRILTLVPGLFDFFNRIFGIGKNGINKEVRKELAQQLRYVIATFD